MERYSELSREELRDLLESLHDKYNRPEFIEHDPISVPHSFSSRDDREVAGLLASTIAWGNRKAIVKSAKRMMQYMDNAPADFVRNASARELYSPYLQWSRLYRLCARCEGYVREVWRYW